MVVSEYPIVVEKLLHKRLLVVAISLITVLAFGLIIGGLGAVDGLPYTGLYWAFGSGEVTEVPGDSPAADADLRTIDTVVALNGISIRQEEAYSALYSGAELTLTVRRGDETRMVRITPVSPTVSILLSRVVPMLVALCFLLFGVGVWVYKPYDRTVILYWLFSLVGAAVLGFGTFSKLGLPWASRWFGFFFTLLSAVLVHFHMHLAHRNLSSPQNRWLTRILYLIVLLVAVLWLRYEVPVQRWQYRLLSNSISLYFVLAIAMSAYLLGRAYISYDSLAQRRGVRLVIFGTVLGFLPLLVLSLLPDVFLQQEFIPYEVTFAPLLFIPMAYGVAIHQHNLLHLQRVVNRHSLVLLTGAVLIAVYLVIATNLPRFLPESWSNSPLVWGVATLVLAAVFAPVRQLLQTIIDRLFYEGWYNYGSVVSEMSQRLRGVVNQDELADLLVNHVAETMRLSGASLLLLGEGQKLELVRAERMHPPRKYLRVSGPLTTALRMQTKPVTATALRNVLQGESLSKQEHDWLTYEHAYIWVPLVRQQTLLGVLLLGERLDGDLLEDDDYRLLDTLASGAATAAENVRLVRELSQRTAQVNLLYSQLLRSREEERKRLARDLHDQTIQDLVNVFHDLNLKMQLDPKAGKSISELQDGLRTTINDLRLICSELRPAALDDLGLVLALHGYVDQVKSDHEIDVSFVVEGGDDLGANHLSEDVKITLYRVLQEAVRNVLQHSEADRMWIELLLEEERVSLEIRDNGKGFNCPPNLGTLTRKHHFGLAGMQERVNLIGGSLTVSSAVGRGTCVNANVELSSATGDVALTRLENGVSAAT